MVQMEVTYSYYSNVDNFTALPDYFTECFILPFILDKYLIIIIIIIIYCYTFVMKDYRQTLATGNIVCLSDKRKILYNPGIWYDDTDFDHPSFCSLDVVTSIFA